MASPARSQIAPSERLAFRAKELAALLGISERKLREIQHALPRVVIGGVVLFPRRELEAWLAQQAAVERRNDDTLNAVLSDLMGERSG